MPTRVYRSAIPLPTLLATLALGAAGAGAATLGHLPLPVLLGSLLATAAAAVAGLRLFGHAPALPGRFRLWSIPVVGVAIGGAFHPGIFAEAGAWWPSLVALALFIPAAQGLGYLVYARLGGFDPATAFFGAIPGGLITAIAMGEEAGADGQMTTMLQFMRLIFCISIVPMSFTVITGGAVGSAAGAVIGGPHALGAADVVVLAAAAVLGLVLGERLRLPAAIITGPLLVSGAAHLAGLTEAVPPNWLIQLTQLFVGTSLGAQFSGLGRRAFGTALVLAFTNVCLTLALGLGFAFALHRVVDEPVGAVFLAFAPGGVAEMSLVAVSLHISVIYVTAHHVTRIILAVTLARVFAGRVARAAAAE